MQKRRLFGTLFLIFVLLAFWLWTKNAGRTVPKEEQLTITALPVGKADALILQQGDIAILVDTGEEEDGAYLLSELKRRGIGRLDLMIITHFDKDHVGSAAFITEEIPVNQVLMPDYEGDRKEYQDFLFALGRQPMVKAERLAKSWEGSFGKLQMAVYPAENSREIQDTEGEYDNDMSLVVSMIYGETRFLLCGDIEKTRIRQMLNTETDWRHDWIKMPHHGRYTKALKELLNAVRPSAAVICCSEEEPAEEKTLALLEEKKIPVWDTSARAVVTVSDGQRTEVRYED